MGRQMNDMQRYAVYYAPRPGAFADAAAAWLGWDASRGIAVPHPDLGLPLADLTDAPRVYGFHATLRAPFQLASGLGRGHVDHALDALARRLSPVICDGLLLEDIEGFLAFTPQGNRAMLMDFAAEVVRATNPLRAPLTPAEIARRRPETLTQHQRELLAAWGYPYVMDAFECHLTLTRRLDADQTARARHAASAHFAALLPSPFVIQDLCLFGQDTSGRFHLLHRYPLSG